MRVYPGLPGMLSLTLYMAGKPFKCSLRRRKKQSSGLNWRATGEQETRVKKKLQNLFSYFFLPAGENGRHTNGINSTGSAYALNFPIYVWKAL